MTKPNDPTTLVHDENGACTHLGLNKREYFAAKAMQAIASNPDWAKPMATFYNWDEYKDRIASCAVELADALIESLNK